MRKNKLLSLKEESWRRGVGVAGSGGDVDVGGVYLGLEVVIVIR